MPVCLKPGGKYPYVLKGDREEKEPPTFFLKYLSYDQQVDLGAAYDAVVETRDNEKMRNELRRILAETIVGWERMDRPFDVSQATAFLDFREITELANAALVNGRVNVEEKKSSE